jgi:hypothetical protein
MNQKGTDLIKIDDDPEGVAEAKDNDDAHQDHGNTLVPLLSAGGLLVEVADVGDGSVDQAVGDYQNHEGKKCHEEKVSQKDVVTDIARVLAHGSETYRVHLSAVYDGFTSFECFIAPSDTSIEFIKPGDVPEDAQEDGWQDIEQAGKT